MILLDLTSKRIWYDHNGFEAIRRRKSQLTHSSRRAIRFYSKAQLRITIKLSSLSIHESADFAITKWNCDKND